MLNGVCVQENEANDNNLSNFRLKETIEVIEFSSYISNKKVET